MSYLHRLRSIIKVRVSTLGLVFAIIGVFLTGELEQILTMRVIIALLAVPLIVNSVFIINDICDAELDKLTKPDRPIASGLVSKREAFIVAAVFGIIGVLLAWTAAPLLAIAIFNLFVGILYSLKFKQILLLGNISTAYLNSSVFIYGALTVASLTTPVIWATILAFLFTVAYEVLYAVEDLEGDAQGGIKTTAHHLGQARSLWLVRTLCITAIGFGLMPFVLNLSSYGFLITILVFCVTPICWVIYRIQPDASAQTIRQSRLVMTFVQYLSAIPLVLLYFGF